MEEMVIVENMVMMVQLLVDMVQEKILQTITLTTGKKFEIFFRISDTFQNYKLFLEPYTRHSISN